MLASHKNIDTHETEKFEYVILTLQKKVVNVINSIIHILVNVSP